MRAATLLQDTVVRKEGKPEGEGLGQYRAGTQVRVFYPARNGWYAMYFANPVKGSHYGWMPESSLQIADAAAPAAAASSQVQQTQQTTQARVQQARRSGVTKPPGTMLGLTVGPQLVGSGGGMSFGFGADMLFPGRTTVFGLGLTYFGLGNVVTTRSDKAFVGDLELLYFPGGAAQMNGFYAGLKGGLMMIMYGGTETTSGITYAISGSDYKLQVAPTLGMLFGGGSMRYGLEGAYRLVLGTGAASVISFAASVQFAI